MAILTFAVGLTLAAEVANTAIEDLCDKVEPNDDWQIGKVKDTMSGFVLIIAMTCAAVAILIYSRHI
jgi:diacylglycerol kinase (ATP)